MAEPDAARGRAPLLEVAVLHPRDVSGADEGGADRIQLADRAAAAGGLSPSRGWSPASARRPTCRSGCCSGSTTRTPRRGASSPGWWGWPSPTSTSARRVWCSASSTRTCSSTRRCAAHLAAALPGVPWTFSRAVDASLETDRVWQQVAGLPGLDAVHSAGSPRGLDAGFDDLVDARRRRRRGGPAAAGRRRAAGRARAVAAARRGAAVPRRHVGAAGRVVGQGVRRRRARAVLAPAARRRRRPGRRHRMSAP